MDSLKRSLAVMGLVLLAGDSIANDGLATGEPPATVRRIKVLPDKAPDCTTLKSIVDSVTRGCRTNDEKAIAIYNFMRLTHYHRAYPSERGGIPVLKEINCYGWSLCGGLHAEQSALWRELGWNWRFVGWPGHTTVEAFYDGRWHYLDVFLKFYAWMPDANQPSGRTIAGEDDLAANPQELLLDRFVSDPDRRVMYEKGNEFALFGGKANWQAPAFLVCGDDLPGIIQAIRQKNRVGAEPGWNGIEHATGSYSADVNLSPGFSLTTTWDKADGAWYWAGSQVAPCHTCGDKEIRNSPEKGPLAEPYLGPEWTCESYANGELSFHPDLSRPDSLQSFYAVENVLAGNQGLRANDPAKPARVTVLLKSPYLMTQASGTADGDPASEISIDHGKSWIPIELKDFGKAVDGQVQALLRLTLKNDLKDLSLKVTLQNNPFSLPYLSPGKNVVSVSVDDPKSLRQNKLVITYAYRTGQREKSYEQLFLEGKEIARGHDARWETQTTVVQKEFLAGDLPASFEIDIPTAAGKYPVYPRMVFVRREVLSPGQPPLPVPANSVPPRRAPGDDLRTLPNPFLVGTQPSPPKENRPVRTVSIELKSGPFVTRSGKPSVTEQLRWPKTKEEQVEPVALLIGGSLLDKPAMQNLAAARLVISVQGAHDKAPARLGVTALKSPLVADHDFDFDQLGEVLTTVVIPQQPADGPAWSPPKEFKLDVTRHLRAMLRGTTTFHGFGLRVVPDRSVDDGWTVRVQLQKPPKILLEIDTFESQ